VRRVYACILGGVVVVGVAALALHAAAQNVTGERPERLRPASCPPFHLLDEDGRIINPVADPDIHIPYSPRRTCGACHDYGRITQGYHFQMGATVMADNFGAPERPWDLSDGMVGKFDHLYIRQFAKKELSGPRDFDLTAYDWVHECGVCHPGGGSMERDRDGHRYDVRQRTDSELAQLLDGDYYGARWAESGVVEADCLVCHLPEGYYDYGIRVEQIRKLNYRYAATAAAGFAGVAGSVSEGDTPFVVYNTRLFNADGKVKLPIQRPTDRSCLHCHDEGFIKTRGVSFQDHYNHDIHSERGIRCIDCHPGDINHNFAKGDSSVLTLRDDLDGTMRSCEQCHLEGFLNAPKMVHRGLPEFHLTKIACTTCHVAPVQLVPVGAVDVSTGQILNLPAVTGAEKFGVVAESPSAYEIGKDGFIYPYNNVLPVWWGHKQGAIIYPLYLKEIEPAYTAVLRSIYEKEYPSEKEDDPEKEPEKEIPADIMKEIVAGLDDNGDGKPEINTDDEIRMMLAALKTVATRFDPIEPVYVKGDKIYELDANGHVTSERHRVAEPLHWSLSHNVAPRDKALGYNGCTDCHSPGSRFFFGSATVDPFGEDGKPVTQTMATLLGWSERDFTPDGYLRLPRSDRKNYPAQFYAARFMAVLLWGVFIFFAIHTLAWLPTLVKERQLLPKDGYGKREDKVYQRFSPFERFLHVLVVVSFLGLAITGMSQKFAHIAWAKWVLQVMGGVEVAQLVHHVCAGVTFFYFGAHLIEIAVNFVSTKGSRYEFWFGERSLFPMPRDFIMLYRNVKYFLRLGPRPDYDRWNYWEKFDYFAVFWGVAVIGFTGLLLWVPKIFANFTPGWMFAVARIVHSDEAILAVVYVFTVHFINVHLKPGRFPVDTSIFTGRVSLAHLKHERPAEYARLTKEGALDTVRVEPVSTRVERISRVFAYCALVLGVVLLILTVWGMVAS